MGMGIAGFKGVFHRAVALAALSCLLIVPEVLAETVLLSPSKDNTLYEPENLSSNAKGNYIFSGVTGRSMKRRALLAFDIPGSIPAGATIESAMMVLTLSLAPTGSPDVPLSLHSLTRDWGEGTSIASTPEGAGGDAKPGDATWDTPFIGTDQKWSALGGDFNPEPSATIDVNTVLLAKFVWESDLMAADVQHWLNEPSSNFGWLLRGGESDPAATARRFMSRENASEQDRPKLLVTYTTGTPAPGKVYQVLIQDDQFVPRTLSVAPGDTIVWYAATPNHTVTADDGSFDSRAGGLSTIPVGSTFVQTFAEAGNYPFYCAIKGGAGSVGMSGMVQVVLPGSNTAPTVPVNVSPSFISGVSTAPLLQGSAFSDADEGDTHQSSQWLVRLTSDGSTVIDSGEDRKNKTNLRLIDLLPGTSYTWQVRYRDSQGNWSAYSIPTQFVTEHAKSPGTGIDGEYSKYNAKTQVATLIATRRDPTIDFNWEMDRPHPEVSPNNFKVQWEGRLVPKYSEQYRFQVRADSGVRLRVNGQLVINDWVVTPFPVYRSGRVNLEAGVPVPIRLEFFDTKKDASVTLKWSSFSQPLEVVPQSRLYP
jgi:plastocyanin